jgi:hypothetical protein
MELELVTAPGEPSAMKAKKWARGEVEEEFAACATLKDVIDQLEREHASRGEVICEVRVNGLLLAEEDESRFASSPLCEISDLAILSSRSADLIRQALRSVAAFMPGFNEICLKTADVIRDGGLGSAGPALRDIVDGCRWAVDTLIHARGAASGIGQPLIQAERWHEAEKTLAATVRELVAAFEARDAALVADILEYEATGAAAIWIEAIERELATKG